MVGLRRRSDHGGRGEALSALIEARQTKHETVSHLPGEAHTGGIPPGSPEQPRTGVGSRPRTCASLGAVAVGRPAVGFLRLAAKFSLAEQATLALVAAETASAGDCRLSVPHLAALVGVAETTVRNAIREGSQARPAHGRGTQGDGLPQLPNVVRIVSPEWTAWLRLARKGAPSRDPLAVRW